MINEIINNSTIKELKQLKKDLPKISKAIDNQIEFLKEMEE
jgi:hypothetical protein